MQQKRKNRFAVLDSCTTYSDSDDDINGNGEDYISRLPNDVLCLIVSLIPSQSALSTNLLSTRWQGLWKASTLIGAMIITQDDDKLKVAILKLVADSNSLHSTRSLEFYSGRDRVILATALPRNKLVLDFSVPNADESPWPCWHVTAHPEPSCAASASFVRSLHLKSVTCLTKDLASSVAQHLHHLESLHISKCKGLISLCVEFGPRLLHLRVSDCMQLKYLDVTADKLVSFRLQCLLPFVSLSSACLKDVMLLSRKDEPKDIRLPKRAWSLEFDVTEVETLTLCKWTIQAMMCPSKLFRRLKSLWWIEYSASDGREFLMSFLRYCPALEQLFITIDPSSTTTTTTKCISSQGSSCTNKLKHLKVVALEGFASMEEELLVADQLRGMLTKDPRELILSRSQDNRPMRILKGPLIREELKGMRDYYRPRQRNWSYKYVEEVELCPKHAHMCS